MLCCVVPAPGALSASAAELESVAGARAELAAQVDALRGQLHHAQVSRSTQPVAGALHTASRGNDTVALCGIISAAGQCQAGGVPCQLVTRPAPAALRDITTVKCAAVADYGVRGMGKAAGSLDRAGVARLARRSVGTTYTGCAKPFCQL